MNLIHNIYNFTLVGITPLAKMFMNNLEEIGNQFDFLLNSTIYIYILDHCIADKYQTKLDIIGEIRNSRCSTNFKK